MNKFLAKKYYGREEIQSAILKFAKNREIGTRFDGYFGKRPDMIEYTSDVKSLIKNDIQSFHMSEEIWENPLILGNEKGNDEERAKNRIGWDLILDLDGVDIVFAKIVGKIIIEHLQSLGIKSISTKFSGNKGFHIGVPFQSFSKEILGIGETRLLFPEAPRRIASYLLHELKGEISKQVLEYEGSIEKIANKYNLNVEDLISEDESIYNFNFMKVIDIDTILISSRHLFRMPYSLNEKSELVSIPIKNELIMDFEKFLGKPFRVDPKKYEKFEFLRYDEKNGKDADILLIKAYEDNYEDMVFESMNLKKNNTEFSIEINEKIDIKDFPKAIQHILNNKFEDGKKRALFVLLTFLYSINYSDEAIESIVNEWDEKQPSPLKRNYVSAQVSWFKNQSKKISTPNYDNANYYESIGVPKKIIEEDRKKFRGKDAKNPIHHVLLSITSKNSKK